MSRAARVSIALFALLHWAIAIAWLVLAPSEFGWDHRLTWAHRVVPTLLFFAGSGPLSALLKHNDTHVFAALSVLLGFWGGLGLGIAWFFPQSRGWWWCGLVVVGLLAVLPWPRKSLRLRALVALISAIIGASLAPALRADEAGTRPSGGEVTDPAPEASQCDFDGRVRFALGEDAGLVINPLLVFESVSPDRFWSALAPGDRWRGQPVRCRAMQRDPSFTRYWFSAEGSSVMDVRSGADANAVILDVTSSLPQAVYSHLNHHLQLRIGARNRLGLQFSACPGLRVQPGTVDAPSQFAFIDADATFVVAEASKREKGPFVERCRESIDPSTPLRIDIVHDDDIVGSVTLMDWSAQVDLNPSPTAGWGVPANALEMWANPRGTEIFLSGSLSATSIGRGWDTVGHAAGVYRNRVELTAGIPN